jgi:hypothetical protein
MCHLSKAYLLEINRYWLTVAKVEAYKLYDQYNINNPALLFALNGIFLDYDDIPEHDNVPNEEHDIKYWRQERLKIEQELTKIRLVPHSNFTQNK